MSIVSISLKEKTVVNIAHHVMGVGGGEGGGGVVDFD